HEGHHDLDVGQAHLVAHALHCAALELEAVAEGFADVTGGAAEAQHRVFFLGLVQATTDQVGIFVGLEVRQANDDFLRPEGSSQGAHTLDQLVDIEADRVSVAGDALLDAVLDFRGQAIEIQQRLGVHTDHAVDDEFQTGQANTLVGQVGKVEGAVRVADVHHDLERQRRHGIDTVGADIKLQAPGIDHARVAFGAGNCHFLAIAQLAGGVAATDDRGNAQLAGDDRSVAGTAATVGDDGTGALHYRLPIGIGHVGHQDVARLDFVHLGHVTDHLDRAGADTLANGAAFNQHGALFLQQVTFHHVDVAAALHGLRARLDDVQLAVITVFGPLDIHRTTIVLFDGHRLLGQAHDFFIAQAETSALGLVHVDGLHRAASAGHFAIDHLDGLATQVTAQDRRTTRFQGRLVNIELVRLHGALHHSLTQRVGAGDEDHTAEARLGVQGEHDAGGTGFRATHALHTGGQCHQLVVEALVYAVGKGAVVEK